MNFDEAYERLIKYEGGYSNDPDDKGGETYKGISRYFNSQWVGWKTIDKYKNYPNFPKNLDNNELLQRDVRLFYLTMFWNKIHGSELPFSVANELFEQAVNFGVKTAVTHFQRVLNILYRGKDLEKDGKFGNATLGRAKELLDNNIKNQNLAVKMLNILQGYRYIKLMEVMPTYEKFIGWFNRVEFQKD